MWGGTFPAARMVAEGGIPAVGGVMASSLGGGLILLLWALARGRPPPLRRRYLLYYLMTGAVGIAIPSTAMYAAAGHMPSGVLSMLVTTSPMLTYGLALALGMEMVSWRRLAGIALGFAGVLLLLAPRLVVPGDDFAKWALIGLIAPAGWATNTALGARFRPPQGDSVALASAMLLTAAVLLSLVAWPADLTFDALPPWHQGHLGVLILALVNGFAHVLFFLIMARGGPVFLGQVGYIVTGTGVLWGMLLFGERHGPMVWLALAVLFAGVAMVNPGVGRRPRD
jgi:drug/metabolite transporter (DMT)-like permease